MILFLVHEVFIALSLPCLSVDNNEYIVASAFLHSHGCSFSFSNKLMKLLNSLHQLQDCLLLKQKKLNYSQNKGVVKFYGDILSGKILKLKNNLILESQ